MITMKELSAIQSMTGFGSAEGELLSVEIRSVNHRYFDVYFRMPHFVNKFEIELRKRLKDVFSRGRFEVNIAVFPGKMGGIRVNEELIAGIVKSLEEVKEKFSLKGDVSLDLLAGFKDVLATDNSSLDESELTRTFDEAVSRLYEMRVAEGSYTEKDLSEMLESVKGYVHDIISESGDLKDKLRQRFFKKFNDLLENNGIDENRLVQEVSVLVERADISEELARLQSHIKQFKEIMDGGGTVGRKLDFLLQEFFREANTIAAKTSEYDVVSTIVDLKNEIEKLREQVQNIQ